MIGRCPGVVITAALLTAAIGPAPAAPAVPPGPPMSDEGVTNLALQWFKQTQAGTIERSEYAAGYSAQLTDDAVREMSRNLNQYGASPTGARILTERALPDQTLYAVKLLFPRGDTASVLLGLDTNGKITGIVVMTLAGN